MAEVRVGIDVGGTFTHAVAVDPSSLEVIAHSVVPTTHFAVEGVAKGIVLSLNELISRSSLKPEDITFIAHSTTQATNALLEGDVAKVGVIGMGSGLEGLRVRQDTGMDRVMLSSLKKIDVVSDYVDTGDRKVSEEEFVPRIRSIAGKGAAVLVAAEAFSVDDPSSEISVIEFARKLGLPACGTHELSGLYGLKVRTLTSVINASVLPKMLEAARMTFDAVGAAGISAPLMVMRSDGGVLSLDEVKKRPILTMLSGPAAGVAAALMYEKVSDGIFLEVGGTSTDITVIKDGRALVRGAEVGGHKLYLKTLDVRTVGLAGGSMIRFSGGKIIDVGPRSAHIAGLSYLCFAKDTGMNGLSMENFSPKTGDPADYVKVRAASGREYALTVTCAANALNLVPQDDWAFADSSLAMAGMKAISLALGVSAEQAAIAVLDSASGKFAPIIERLIKEYKLDRGSVVLIGGGGGASAIVPYLAKKLKFDFRIAKNNHIVSAIGVSLALLHETVERSVINPGEEDILRVRREAEAKLISMGARPETVEIAMEIDAKRNIIRASAFGATELRGKRIGRAASPAELKAIAAKSMKAPEENVKLVSEIPGFSVFGGVFLERRFFGLVSITRRPVRVVDGEGIVRLQRGECAVLKVKAKNARQALKDVLKKNAVYGDAGERLPGVYVLCGGKILNLSGLTGTEEMLSLLKLELSGKNDDEDVLILSA